MKRRVFIIVLDSLGIGALPDAEDFGDEGSHTLKSISRSSEFSVPNLLRAGLGNIEGNEFLPREIAPVAAFGRMAEKSRGKDTTVGHWELMGVVSPSPLPTYPDGFPDEVIRALEAEVGRKVLCNKPFSGTEVIRLYGEEHMKTGALIVYTSADSVFQIAAHEEIVPLEELYAICRKARTLLRGKHGVGRVIARPFVTGENGFVRTPNRHDFSLEPPERTLLDVAKEAGLEVIAIGKIEDIFASRGITRSVKTKSNADGMAQILAVAKEDFEGICFLNLVEFDSLYGHRNDVDGYAAALSEFDAFLPALQEELNEGDMLFVTADHGCDPGTPSTDHSREYVPVLAFGQGVKPVSLGTAEGFSALAAACGEYLGLDVRFSEKSIFSAM